MGIAAALLVGTALQVSSTIQQGNAAASAAKYNIRAIQRQRSIEQAASLKIGARNRSSNLVAIAKSGVRRDGSPLAVLAANTRQEEEQRTIDFNRQQDQIELLRLNRSSALVGAGLSAGGQALQGTALAAREKFGTDG